jgi:hypothetical protein
VTTEERHRHHFEAVNPQLDRLARRICEASGMGDRVLEQSRYQDLIAFYEEQVKLGHWHPVLTEAVADFTAAWDAAAALPYYRLALDQARMMDAETHTILIWMGQCLFKLGQREQAEAFLRDGRAEALRRGEDEDVREADRVLREASAS